MGRYHTPHEQAATDIFGMDFKPAVVGQNYYFWRYRRWGLLQFAPLKDPFRAAKTNLVKMPPAGEEALAG